LDVDTSPGGLELGRDSQAALDRRIFILDAILLAPQQPARWRR